MSAIERRRVVIAGGGVAGLEALLALRALLGEAVEVEVVAPDQRFTLRQFAVAEPFGFGEHTSFELAGLIADGGGRHLPATVTGVDCRSRVVQTDTGATVSYDELILAVGGSPQSALPGSITYRGPDSNTEIIEALLRLDRGESSGLAFAVPASVQWSLPIYELALLGARYIGHSPGDSGLALVTSETAPLPPFGAEAGARIRTLLERAGVRLHAGVAPARMREDGLALVDDSVVACDQTVALPRLEIAPIEGIPQDRNGFIDTDPQMRVPGCEHVFAAGDATWFPIKQGGIATQQADVAAATIASSIDPRISAERFRPLLRAALLTSAGPLYLRAGSDHPAQAEISSEPLWWPPSKVAGRYLAPFVAAHAAPGNQPEGPLDDLEPAGEGAGGEHEAALEMTLAAADVEAAAGSYSKALRWLTIAERLALILPPDAALRREQWQQALGEERE